MDLGLKGKTALITGGSQGIGLGIAKVMAAEGTRVVIASRSQENVDKAIQTIRSANPEAELVGKSLNLYNEEEIHQVIGGLLSEHGIDILINNVGGPPAGHMADLTVDQWDTGYQGLIRSVVILSELVVPHMKDKNWGRVLTITSTAAKEIIPKLPVSATFRAGLSAWAKALSREVGRSGVLVNNLLPGPIHTARLAELKEKSPEFFHSMESETAVGRIGEPDEVGRVATFLCSEANTFVTGTDILVDGGYTRSY